MAKVIDLQNGDIIKARVNSLPIVYHYGIVIDDKGSDILIIHNTPNKKNEVGGGINIDTLSNWTLTRTIVSKQASKSSKESISRIVKLNASKPFNLINWNCEHFVFLAAFNEKKSPQLTGFIWLVLFILLGIFVLKHEKIRDPKKIALTGLLIVSFYFTFQESTDKAKVLKQFVKQRPRAS